MTDDLSLIIGSQSLSGWTEISVIRGIEKLPSSFEISLTEPLTQPTAASIVPGQPCQVKLGNDLVITGYVDRYAPSISAFDHRVRVSGRSKCQDLVDCSAEWPNNQISNVSALALAQKLAKPYGITVTAASTAAANAIVQTYVMLWGETAYDVLERACRFSQLLAYDGADGNLILAQVGTAQAASGFTEGKNVISAEAAYSIDQRYSDYVVRRMSFSSLNDLGQGGDIMRDFPDQGVPRHRLRYIIAENGGNPQDVALARGQWEARRRAGRAFQLRVTTDSWRDAAGTLWTPNTLVPVSLPSLKITNKVWVIGEVTYKRDGQSGTTAELLIMPPDAFQPEPILLLPPIPDLVPNAASG